jgi:hypothetical protein
METWQIRLMWGAISMALMHELWAVLRGHASNSWRRHPANVIDAGISRDSNTDGGNDYSAYVKYAYMWHGRHYTGSRLKYGKDLSYGNDKASENLIGICAGKEIQIYVNPLRPQQSVIRKGYNGSPLYFVLFIAFGVAMDYFS